MARRKRKEMGYVRRLNPDEIRSSLSELERKYGMTSSQFYLKYTSGQTDERRDFVRWAGLYHMLSASSMGERLVRG